MSKNYARLAAVCHARAEVAAHNGSVLAMKKSRTCEGCDAKIKTGSLCAGCWTAIEKACLFQAMRHCMTEPNASERAEAERLLTAYFNDDHIARVARLRDAIALALASRRAREGQELEDKVAYLTDARTFSWTQMMGCDAAARLALKTLADLGIIQHHLHQYGGDIWIVGNKGFGRLDGVDVAALAAKGERDGK